MPDPRVLFLNCEHCHQPMQVSVPTEPDSLLDFSMAAASMTDRYSEMAAQAIRALQVAEQRIAVLEARLGVRTP